MKDNEIAEILRRENEEFRRLADEHKRLEEALAEIDKKRFLTSDEEIERKRIQKQKLRNKDLMAEMIRQYRQKVGATKG
ncbi:MAG: DUF465 domain-containing protein [Thermodesulfovibrionia bacterium]